MAILPFPLEKEIRIWGISVFSIYFVFYLSSKDRVLPLQGCIDILNHLLARDTEKATAPHSSSLAWNIPWTEEPGGLQSMGSQRVGHDWATSLSLFTFMHWEGHDNPLQCSCLENPRDGRAWWAAVYGVAQSRTQLKRLSSSSRQETRIWVSFLKTYCVDYSCQLNKGNSELCSIWLDG